LSEVQPGSREENASKQEAKARFGFNQNESGFATMRAMPIRKRPRYGIKNQPGGF
jgi:hypothetical protein